MVELRSQDARAACAGGAALVTEFGQVNNDTVGVAALAAATRAFEKASQGWTIWSVQLMNWLQVKLKLKLELKSLSLSLSLKA